MMIFLGVRFIVSKVYNEFSINYGQDIMDTSVFGFTIADFFRNRTSGSPNNFADGSTEAEGREESREGGQLRREAGRSVQLGVQSSSSRQQDAGG